jgi:hypothetical protein
MEETGVLENVTLLSFVLPDFEPGPISDPFSIVNLGWLYGLGSPCQDFQGNGFP